MKKTMQKIESNPKSLFVMDAFGAILSAFLLGVVLVRFEHIFGIPASALYILAVIPIFFAMYDFYSYRKDNHEIGPYLIGIAIMNLLYCILSIGMAFHHKEVVKFWGWYYIVSEVLIVGVLVYFELKMAKKLM